MRLLVICGVLAVSFASTGALLADPPSEPTGVRPATERPSRKFSLEKEKANWTRRMDACHKLKMIAFETGDPELERQAEELEKQALLIYVQRTGDREPHAQVDSATEKEAARRLLGRLGPEETESTRRLLGGMKPPSNLLMKSLPAAPLQAGLSDRPLRSVTNDPPLQKSGRED